MPDRPIFPSSVSSSAPERAASTASLAELIQRAIAGTDEGFALYDGTEEPALLYANASFYELLALPRPVLDARPLQALFDDAFASRTLRVAVARHEGCTLHVHGRADAEPTRTLVLLLTPIRDDAAQLTHWLCTLRALRNERESARARSEHERLSAVTLVVAGLAHEINNPLASITTNLEWLVTSLASTRPGQPPPRQSELASLSAALVDALAGAERIEATVRQLQALAGTRYEAAELLDVRVLLDAALHEIEPLFGGSIELRRSYAEVPPIRGLQGQLRQAFAQLLSNAAQSITPDCARRVVEVRAETRERVRIEIDDSGSGIAPEVQAELFRPFVTTKPLGWGKGLGLFIARSSIEAAGGTIGFESLTGGGTRFWVELPIAEGQSHRPFDSTAEFESVPPNSR